MAINHKITFRFYYGGIIRYMGGNDDVSPFIRSKKILKQVMVSKDPKLKTKVKIKILLYL